MSQEGITLYHLYVHNSPLLENGSYVSDIAAIEIKYLIGALHRKPYRYKQALHHTS